MAESNIFHKYRHVNSGEEGYLAGLDRTRDFTMERIHRTTDLVGTNPFSAFIINPYLLLMHPELTKGCFLMVLGWSRMAFHGYFGAEI